jgi:hypothetical protein
VNQRRRWTKSWILGVLGTVRTGRLRDARPRKSLPGGSDWTTAPVTMSVQQPAVGRRIGHNHREEALGVLTSSHGFADSLSHLLKPG